LSSEAANDRRGLAQSCFGQIGQHHFGPFGEQKLCRRNTDTAGAAGDQAYLVFHLLRHDGLHPLLFLTCG
jgi:hypothetical protein